MHSSNRSARRRMRPQLGPEALEGRALLTGGAGNTFAIEAGTIGAPGGSVVLPFVIDPAQFTLPKGKFTIGIDVVPATGSSVQPLLAQVNNQHNDIIPQAITTIYNPHLSHAAVARGRGTRAVLAPLSLFAHQPKRPSNFSVVVAGESHSQGAFLAGFYLPGDADGDGTVNQNDINIIKSELGARSGDSRYTFDADANRDGRIGPIDMAYARQNFGVATTVTPLVTAKLDPNSDTGIQDRITKLSSVHFSGQGTPGASVSFTETGASPTTLNATVGADGTYSVMLPLGEGTNQIHVSSTDGFGQTITGAISPVKRDGNAPDYIIPLIHTDMVLPASPTPMPGIPAKPSTSGSSSGSQG